MANYDQSGNPLGDRNASQQGGQQGGHASGQTGGRTGQGGQQAQYAAGQEQGRGMQRSSGRAVSGQGGGSYPDLYGGVGAGPFALISRLSDEMDRLFDSFGFGAWPTRTSGRAMSQGGTGQGSLRTLWAPHIEVAERDGKLLVQADLPGVRKEDVSVRIEQDAILIEGQRHQETERNEQGFYHSERSYGSFYRIIPLPEGIDPEQANATFRDGVLRIEVPMPQQRQRGRRLEIRDESPSPGSAAPSSMHASAGGQGTAGQATAQAGSGAQQGAGPQSSSGQMGSTERR